MSSRRLEEHLSGLGVPDQVAKMVLASVMVQPVLWGSAVTVDQSGRVRPAAAGPPAGGGWYLNLPRVAAQAAAEAGMVTDVALGFGMAGASRASGRSDGRLPAR